ncbi:MAG: type II toxin-antitoxin system HicA family toxin [Sedimentisphaerales bacterium]|nr:type II toxin-antitoxin system HicA family toxin [Sedimentisphaerales bacterium]
MNKRKLLRKVLSGSKNIRFGDMITLARAFGFRLARIEGSHHIMVHPSVPRPLNMQEVGGQAKPYQIRQFLKLVEQYDLTMEE